jgi:glutamate decarboxylase
MVPVSEESGHTMDPKKALEKVDENTICVVCILGSTYTGKFEDVQEMSKLLDKLEKEKVCNIFGFIGNSLQGLDVSIHVDAASGGFTAPFTFPNLKWDFRLPRVHTINVSGHKYGLVYPGLGWAIWRERKYLPEELVFHLAYLGGDNETFSLNFSMSSFQMIAQYYNFLRLGREGYTDVITNCMNQAKFLSNQLLVCKYFNTSANN